MCDMRLCIGVIVPLHDSVCRRLFVVSTRRQHEIQLALLIRTMFLLVGRATSLRTHIGAQTMCDIRDDNRSHAIHYIDSSITYHARYAANVYDDDYRTSAACV